MQIIERLLEKPCYIIDFLPRRVPLDCCGQFFKVEDYLLNQYEYYGLKDRFIRIVLKSMCYDSVSVYWKEWIEQPSPEQIVEIINLIMEEHLGNMNMLFTSKNVLLQLEGDSLHMSLYNPDKEMCLLFEQIAFSEGMFLRKAE